MFCWLKKKLPIKYLHNLVNIPQICTVPNNLDLLSGLFLTRIFKKKFCQSATLYYTWNLSVLRMIKRKSCGNEEIGWEEIRRRRD